MSTIGERIKETRTKIGLSADELAEKIGKNRTTVFRYENGDIGNLPIEIVSAIAKALGTSPIYLMGWDNLPTSRENEAEIKDALKLYEEYKQAIPQVQKAVDALLKPQQSDS